MDAWARGRCPLLSVQKRRALENGAKRGGRTKQEHEVSKTSSGSEERGQQKPTANRGIVSRTLAAPFPLRPARPVLRTPEREGGQERTGRLGPRAPITAPGWLIDVARRDWQTPAV